jgi:hypothetical protein
MYTLLKTTYGDFGIEYDTVIAVSYNQDALKEEAARLTSLLTDNEKDDGVSFEVPKRKVKVL